MRPLEPLPLGGCSIRAPCRPAVPPGPLQGRTETLSPAHALSQLACVHGSHGNALNAGSASAGAWGMRLCISPGVAGPRGSQHGAWGQSQCSANAAAFLSATVQPRGRPALSTHPGPFASLLPTHPQGHPTRHRFHSGPHTSPECTC